MSSQTETKESKGHIGAALFTSAESEHTTPVQGVIRDGGAVPEWLSGCLLRNGPGLFEVGDTQYRHYFDGLALLRKFSIANGRVEFTSQFLRSDSYTTNMAYKRIVIGEFGTRAYPDPCKSLLGRFASMFYTSEEEARLKAQTTDNTLVNVFPIGDQVFAATETHFLNRIDPNTLDRLDKVDLNRAVPVNTATAHPHFEPDGGVLNLGTEFRDRSGPKYLVVRIPSGGVDKAEVVASIPARWSWNPAYYHSFGVTRNYLLMVESPLTLSVARLIVADKLGFSFDGCMCWHKGSGALIHVVSRADGRLVQTFAADDFFTFHHMNAYEEESKDGNGGCEIVMDVSAYQSGEVIQRLSLKDMQQMTELPKRDLSLRRYRMTLNNPQQQQSSDSNLAKATFTEPAKKLALEFPQINYRYNGQAYRYGYGVGSWTPPGASSDTERIRNSSILKLDWQTEEVLQWHSPGHEPSEAIFVEHPEPASEDHGVLLASVIGVEERRTLFLLILDAKTMAEVAKVDFQGVSVPSGFHGMFFSEEQLLKAAATAGEKRQVEEKSK